MEVFTVYVHDRPTCATFFRSARAFRREVASTLDTSWADGTAGTVNHYSQIKAITDFARCEIFCLAAALGLVRDKMFIFRRISVDLV